LIFHFKTCGTVLRVHGVVMATHLLVHSRQRQRIPMRQRALDCTKPLSSYPSPQVSNDRRPIPSAERTEDQHQSKECADAKLDWFLHTSPIRSMQFHNVHLLVDKIAKESSSHNERQQSPRPSRERGD